MYTPILSLPSLHYFCMHDMHTTEQGTNVCYYSRAINLAKLFFLPKMCGLLCTRTSQSGSERENAIITEQSTHWCIMPRGPVRERLAQSTVSETTARILKQTKEMVSLIPHKTATRCQPYTALSSTIEGTLRGSLTATHTCLTAVSFVVYLSLQIPYVEYAPYGSTSYWGVGRSRKRKRVPSQGR